MKIDCKTLAQEVLDNLIPQIQKLKDKKIIPTLAIILIGKNSSSKSYIKQKKLKAQEIGVEIKLFEFEKTSEDQLLTLIDKLNNNEQIHGIIVQRPLPQGFNSDKISKTIINNKDVDGFRVDSKFVAPVVLAVKKILNKIGERDLSSKNIVVIGKGETAGGPIIKYLLKLGAKPLIIDSKTNSIDEKIKNADIIISAVGKPNIMHPYLLNSKQILIGVGLFKKDGKLKGDYDTKNIEDKVKYYTPTVGGVGPLNVAFLMQNLVKASGK